MQEVVSRSTLGALLLVICLVAPTSTVSSPAHAQEARTATRERVVDEHVHIPALEKNVLGDSADQRVVVYLPPSYAVHPERRYPTLYLLHGIAGDPGDWGPDGFQGMDIGRVLDSLVWTGAAEEMIIVTPNGRNRYLGAFYLNSATNGNWEDYIARDLVRHVDRSFRTLPSASSRGIAGHSMGGFGALMLGMRHPDVFGAIYALSPCCLGMVADLSLRDSAWYRLSQYKNWDHLLSEAGRRKDFMPIGYAALAAAISPNPSARPWLADFPVVVQGERLVRNEKAAEKWHATLPLPHIKKNRPALRCLKAVGLDVGVDDEFTHITLGTVLFSDSLSAYRVPHMFELYEGDHRNRIRHRITTRVLPFFSHALVSIAPKDTGVSSIPSSLDCPTQRHPGW